MKRKDFFKSIFGAAIVASIPIAVKKPEQIAAKEPEQTIQITGTLNGKEILFRKSIPNIKVSQEMLDDRKAMSPIIREILNIIHK